MSKIVNMMMGSSQRKPFVDCSAHAARQPRLVVRADSNAGQEAPSDRRSVLLAGSAALLSPLLIPETAFAKELKPGRSLIPISSLNSFQKNSEKAAFVKLVEAELKKELNKPGDAADTLRLVLHDAGTYDVNSNTGGLNGSIRLSEELNRPENSSLKPIVDRLKSVKAKLDDQTKDSYGPISWADLEVLATKVANEAVWRNIKKARGVPSSGDVISSAFGASWAVKLGRIDTDQPDQGNRVPKPDASVAEITEFFGRLNNRDYGATGFFAPKPIFDQRQAFILYGSAQNDTDAAETKLASDVNYKAYAGFREKYSRSRQTVTRTDYEVDFIDYFTQLASLGAKYNPEAYLVPIEIDTPKF